MWKAIAYYYYFFNNVAEDIDIVRLPTNRKRSLRRRREQKLHSIELKDACSRDPSMLSNRMQEICPIFNDKVTVIPHFSRNLKQM